MPYYEKRTYSGPVLECERYYATNGGRPVGSRNEQESTLNQDELNDAQSWRRLWRLINCNFRKDAGDLCLTLRFKAWVSEQEAYRQYAAFLRRVKRIRSKRSLPELKYICVKECQSGWQHAHLILNGGISVEELTELWGKGTVWATMLEDTHSYKALAKYLTEQHKQRRGSDSPENAKEPRRRNQRRWTGSRNLEKPVVKKRPCRPVTIHTMPRAPKGYELMPDFRRDADRFGNLWLRWTCIKTAEDDAACTKRKTKRKVE